MDVHQIVLRNYASSFSLFFITRITNAAAINVMPPAAKIVVPIPPVLGSSKVLLFATSTTFVSKCDS